MLVLGGDCTLEVGIIAGALRRSPSIALVHIDLDADLKVPATGEVPSTGWALPTSSTRMDAWTISRHSGLDGRCSQARTCRCFAPDNITDSEAAIIADARITVETLASVHHSTVAAAERAVEWGSRHDEMWVHVDIDVLSWVHFPIAENSRRRDGLTIDELATVLHLLLTASKWRA
ncbi:MAG: arginase family protein [Marmoricola sp.]